MLLVDPVARATASSAAATRTASPPSSLLVGTSAAGAAAPPPTLLGNTFSVSSGPASDVSTAPSSHAPRASTSSRNVEPVSILVSRDRYDYYIVLHGSHTEAIREFRAAWDAFEASRREPHAEACGLSREASDLIRCMTAPAYLFPIAGYTIYEYGGRFYRRSIDGQMTAPVTAPYSIGDMCLMSGRHVEARRIEHARSIYRWGLRSPPGISYVAIRGEREYPQGEPGDPDPAWEDLRLPGCDRIVAHLRDGTHVPEAHPGVLRRVLRWLK